MASSMLTKSSFAGGRVACRASRVAPSSRGSVAVHAAANRPMWYPGATPPKHLDGTMLGDYGFDPLRLGTSPDRLKWFRAAEIYNGQFAMAGVAGILFTDLVGLPDFVKAGTLDYALDTKTLLIIELVTFAILEAKRYEGYKKTGESGVLAWFPFDPLNMRSDEKRLKEIKNGRLAMLAFVGFCSQYAIYGLGPIECLKLHLEDPGHNNIYTTAVGPETCVTVALLAIWPMIIEATKRKAAGGQAEPIFPWNEPWYSK